MEAGEISIAFHLDTSLLPTTRGEGVAVQRQHWSTNTTNEHESAAKSIIPPSPSPQYLANTPLFKTYLALYRETPALSSFSRRGVVRGAVTGLWATQQIKGGLRLRVERRFWCHATATPDASCSPQLGPRGRAPEQAARHLKTDQTRSAKNGLHVVTRFEW